MDTIYNQLADLIKTSIKKFTKKNSILINKDKNPEYLSGEKIFIDGILTPADTVRRSNSEEHIHNIRIQYLNFTKVNSYATTQAVLDDMVEILMSNRHNRPYWFEMNYVFQTDIDDFDEEIQHKGFQVNIELQECKTL